MIQEFFFAHVYNVSVRLEEWRIQLAIYRKLRSPTLALFVEMNHLEAMSGEFRIGIHNPRMGLWESVRQSTDSSYSVFGDY